MKSPWRKIEFKYDEYWKTHEGDFIGEFTCTYWPYLKEIPNFNLFQDKSQPRGCYVYYVPPIDVPDFQDFLTRHCAVTCGPPNPAALLPVTPFKGDLAAWFSTDAPTKPRRIPVELAASFHGAKDWDDDDRERAERAFNEKVLEIMNRPPIDPD